MPVLALKASRTFWNDSCSLPPHRDVTVMEPPSAGAALAASLAAGALAPAEASLDGAVVAPPELHAAATRMLARIRVRIRSDRFIDHLRWVRRRPRRGRDRRDSRRRGRSDWPATPPPPIGPTGSGSLPLGNAATWRTRSGSPRRSSEQRSGAEAQWQAAIRSRDYAR